MKKNLNTNKITNNKGITLITLIITIIVVLILAGVSINFMFGQDGFISKTNYVASQYKEEEALELVNTKLISLYTKFLSEDEDKSVNENSNDYFQYLADGFCIDDEVESVKLGKPIAQLPQIDITNYSTFIVKLKSFVYEFEIGRDLSVAVLNGSKSNQSLNNNYLKQCTINITSNGILTVNGIENLVAYSIVVDNEIIETTNENSYLLNNCESNIQHKVYVIAVDENANLYKSNILNYTPPNYISELENGTTRITVEAYADGSNTHNIGLSAGEYLVKFTCNMSYEIENFYVDGNAVEPIDEGVYYINTNSSTSIQWYCNHYGYHKYLYIDYKQIDESTHMDAQVSNYQNATNQIFNFKNCTISNLNNTIHVSEVTNLNSLFIVKDNKCISTTNNDSYTLNTHNTGPVKTYVIAIDDDLNIYKSNTIDYERNMLYLIENGVDNTEITGGWQGVTYYGRETGTLTPEDGYMNYVGTGSNTVYAKATVNKIDWEGFSKIKMRAKPYNFLERYSSYGSISTGVINSKADFTTNFDSRVIASEWERPSSSVETIIEADLPSTYVDNTYVYIMIHRCYAYIYDLWFE